DGCRLPPNSHFVALAARMGLHGNELLPLLRGYSGQSTDPSYYSSRLCNVVVSMDRLGTQSQVLYKCHIIDRVHTFSWNQRHCRVVPDAFVNLFCKARHVFKADNPLVHILNNGVTFKAELDSSSFEPVQY